VITEKWRVPASSSERSNVSAHNQVDRDQISLRHASRKAENHTRRPGIRGMSVISLPPVRPSSTTTAISEDDPTGWKELSSMSDLSSLIPVTLLTGFLGSGKTTVLNHVLKQPGMGATAVIVNEFGEIGLDHLLVERSSEDVVLLNSGCLCCTVRGDIVDTLTNLFVDTLRREHGRGPKLVDLGYGGPVGLSISRTAPAREKECSRPSGNRRRYGCRGTPRSDARSRIRSAVVRTGGHRRAG
jgi:hypothetical protein